MLDTVHEAVRLRHSRLGESPVDGIEATIGGCGGCEEDGVRGDAVSVDCSGSLQVIHKQQAQLGDNIHQAVLLADLHGDGEVICKLRWKEQFRLLLQRSCACNTAVKLSGR